MKFILRYIMYIVICTSVPSGVTFAADTLVQNISGGLVSDISGVYGNRVTTLDTGDLRFNNLDGDSIIAGDYFSGYYYDPAYGVFQVDTSATDRVRISNQTTTDCAGPYTGYKLEGFSYNPNFGFMNFNVNTSIYSYICIPEDENSELTAMLGGVAYSPYIGFQSLSGIDFDSSVDIDDDETNTDDNAEGRFIKIEGTVASEKNTELLIDQFGGEVRILGKLTKSTFRKDIHQKVYPVIANLETTLLPDPYSIPTVYLGRDSWENIPEGIPILNNTGIYFRDTEIRLGGENNIEGNKTLVVEGANIYITGNIRNTDGDGILGLIALQKNGIGGNIYIDPSVTDIHAVMYADRSLISYNGSEELDGATPATNLANQLYIRGSLFSENTLGSSKNSPPECPYYVASSNCATENQAMKYDLNFLRKYILVSELDSDSNPTGNMVPQFTGQESFMGDTSRGNTEVQKPGYKKYPVIIEYDPKVQTTPPPFFN